MKKEISLLGLLLTTGVAFGQYAGDAFRYSEIQQTGTARFRSLGGNHAALGGDASTTFGNPAGLGFYNRSEFSISPSLSITNTESNYLGNQTPSVSKTNPNIGHFGIVLAGNSQNENRRWRRTALGVTYSRQVNLHNSFSYQGRNNNSSIADAFAADATQQGYSSSYLDSQYNQSSSEANFLTAAAYQLYLFNPTQRANPNDDGAPYTRYDVGYPNADFPTVRRDNAFDQRETFTSTGAHNQWTFSYAGNYDDKLYIGASLGLTRLRYEYNTIYRENAVGGNIIGEINRNEDLTVSGSGINFSLGAIWKADDKLQLGASVTSPTFTSVRETFNQSLSTDIIGIPRIENGDPVLFVPSVQNIPVLPNDFEYNLTSPLRAMAGATYFLGEKKIGFLTATAEYVGYSGMRVRTSVYNSQDNLDFRNDVKAEVQNTYNNVVNFRAGAEFRFGLLRVRGGLAYNPNPYKQTFDALARADRDKLIYSAGLGVRNDRFFVDLAGSFVNFKSAQQPYTVQNGPSAMINNQQTNAMLTLGVLF